MVKSSLFSVEVVILKQLSTIRNWELYLPLHGKKCYRLLGITNIEREFFEYNDENDDKIKCYRLFRTFYPLY